MVETPRNPAGEFWTGAFGTDAFEKMAERHRRSLEQITRLQQAMMERIRKTQEMEVEFAGRLSTCASPSEYVELMGKWTAARVESALEAQRELQALFGEVAGEALEDQQKRRS